MGDVCAVFTFARAGGCPELPTAPRMCPPMMCPGDCPPAPPCETGHCIPMSLPGTLGQLCPNTCPTAPCGEGSMACPVDYDSLGCPMPITCAPMPMCGEPMQCPQSHDPKGCPVQPMCGPEEMLCMPPAPPLPPNMPGGMPGEGCPPMGWCMPNTVPGMNGQNCPNFCPVDCPNGASMCPMGFGPDGCPMPPTCA